MFEIILVFYSISYSPTLSVCTTFTLPLTLWISHSFYLSFTLSFTYSVCWIVDGLIKCKWLFCLSFTVPLTLSLSLSVFTLSLSLSLCVFTLRLFQFLTFIFHYVMQILFTYSWNEFHFVWFHFLCHLCFRTKFNPYFGFISKTRVILDRLSSFNPLLLKILSSIDIFLKITFFG